MKELKKTINLRHISLNILKDVLYNDCLLSDSFNNVFNEYSLDEKDKAFIEYECRGVLENKSSLDDVMGNHSKVKLKKLDDSIYVLLLIGTFEIIYMDKVPSYATVNEVVNVAKKITKGKLSPFVNGVLRSIERDINKENNDGNNKENIVKEKYCYFKIFNNKEKEFLDEIRKKNIFCEKYTGKLDFKYSKVYYTKKYKELLSLDAFRKGYILISDASSIYLTDKLCELINNNNKQNTNTLKILDVCAAPGGKSLSLYDNLLLKKIYIKTCDISKAKTNKILENINRLNVDKIDVTIRDATMYDKNDFEKYDVVICDVPCSGLGVINKKPDIKEHFTKEKQESLINIQKEIINTSSKYLKPGGILSYSTCTTLREENEDIIEYFIEHNKNYTKLYEKRIGIMDENLCDGFYMCIMNKAV